MGNPRLHRFLAELVRQLDPEARLTDFTDAAGPWYSLRIDVSGYVGKDVQLPARLTESALTQSPVERTLRAILQAHITAIRAQRAIEDSRERMAESPRNPVCRVCGCVIPPGDRVVLERGETLHHRCG